MTLKALLRVLATYPRDKSLNWEIKDCHSYRGDYDQLGVRLISGESTVAEVHDILSSQVGNTHYGFKGGEFTMHKYVDVYLAKWGHTGEQLGSLLLRYLVEKGWLP